MPYLDTKKKRNRVKMLLMAGLLDESEPVVKQCKRVKIEYKIANNLTLFINLSKCYILTKKEKN